MLNDFNPNYVSKHVAPDGSHPAASGFPMEATIRRLDGEQESAVESDPRLAAADAMRNLLAWMVASKARDHRSLSPIATRTLACAWVINPELVGDCAGRMVAKAYGISYQKFSEHAAEFSRALGIRNRFQIHDAKNNKK